MRTVRLVSAHRGDSRSFVECPLAKSVIGRFDLYVCLNNGDGLSKVYNRYLAGGYKGFEKFLVGEEAHEPDDIVVFVHDDVDVVAGNLAQELNRWVDAGFDLLGLAGAREYRIEKPALWHLMAPPSAHSGTSVFHVTVRDSAGNLHQMPEQPVPIHYGPLGEVRILDGLFLAAASDRVRDAGWSFDEDFDFHHYDLASCIRAEEVGLRMRTVFIPVTHFSPGVTSAYDVDFLASQIKFLRKFRGRAGLEKPASQPWGGARVV